MRHRIMPFVVLHVLVPCLLWLTFGYTATAADRPPSSVLHLINDGFVSGELQGSDDPKALRWRSTLFARPLEFPLSAVNAVHYAVSAPQPQPKGNYCFE